MVALSGTVHFILSALEDAGLDITIVAPLHHHWLSYYRRVLRAYARVGRKYRTERAWTVVRHYNRQADQALRHLDVDVIFSPETIPVCQLRDPRPLVFYTDATFDGLVDYYAKFTDMCRPALRQGHRIDQAALTRCTFAIYTSEWAAATAREQYRVDPGKLRIVPRGANVPDVPRATDVHAMIAQRRTERVELLFISREWLRKGGPKTLAIIAELARRGRPVRLTLMGPRQNIREELLPLVRQLGPLHHSVPEEGALWRDAYAGSHFLLLPTQAECFSLAAAEACAFGMPVLATRTGGLPEVVSDEQNGHLFAPDASVDEWCDYIEDVFTDRVRYEALCQSAFAISQQRLNWSVSGARLAAIVQEAARLPRAELD